MNGELEKLLFGYNTFFIEDGHWRACVESSNPNIEKLQAALICCFSKHIQNLYVLQEI
jgi:hypothetical protein